MDIVNYHQFRNHSLMKLGLLIGFSFKEVCLTRIGVCSPSLSIDTVKIDRSLQHFPDTKMFF